MLRRFLAMKPVLSIAIALLAVSMLMFGTAPTAHAATITVDSNTGGSCTLIDAITAANTDTAVGGCPAGSTGADTIVLELNATYTLTAVNNNTGAANGLPSITSVITIDGNGATIERSSSAPDFRIFHVSVGGDLTLDNVTVSGGVSGAGGGIFNNQGTLTITNGTISGNRALVGSGGGIFNTGTGGGIFNAGTLTITNSTISGNLSSFFGGGIFNDGGTLTITNSTIRGNEANAGGGILNTGTTTINFSRIVGNVAPFGGGILNTGTTTINLSRIVGNVANSASGIFNFSGGSVDAENNWWGCDGFPGATGCDDTFGVTTAAVTPRLDLRLTATPDSVLEGGASTLTADFTQNSEGFAVSPVVLDGLTITFSGGTLGSVAPGTATISGGTATTTFTAGTTAGTSTVSATLDDGTETAEITVVTDPPVLAGIEGTTIDYTEGDAATQVTNTITVTDTDSTELSGATIIITSGIDPTEDVLDATPPEGSGIGQAYIAATGTLTLSGAASLADYQVALQSVTYVNTDGVDPTGGTRTLTFQVTDETSNPSNTQSRDINVIPTMATGSIPHTESFESDGEGARYMSNHSKDGCDFFERDTPTGEICHLNEITGLDGGFAWYSEDIPNGNLKLQPLNSTGLVRLQATVALAVARDTWDPGDFFEIQAAFDGDIGDPFPVGGGTYTTIGRFKGDAGGQMVQVPGGTALTTNLQDFTFPIAGSGNLLGIRLVVRSDGSEELAFDNIRVTGDRLAQDDLGDAPDPLYPTLLANDGARHTVGGPLFLGAGVDAEPNGQPSAVANGDDFDSDFTTVGDVPFPPGDEDGVVFTSTPNLVTGEQSNVDVTASVGGGRLNAWIDFNDNGSWGDAGEQIFTDVVLGAGVNSLSFTVPATAKPTNLTFARFRVATVGGLLVTGLAPDGEVEDYALEINGLDFGDAPDPTYPTLAVNNGARHILSTGPHLGAAVDAEPDGQPNATASGDDLATLPDEDGVVFSSLPLTAGTTESVDVTATGPGLLNAWVDFNDNGSWADAGEQIFTDQPLVSGLNPLLFSVPASATPTTQTFARFRFNLGGGLSFDGLAPDGEVEDYEVAIDARAELSIAKTESLDPVAAGNQLTYTLTVDNAGPSDATGVAVSDTLPAGVTFVSTNGCVEDANGVPDCTLGTIAAGGSASYTITVNVDSGTLGTITNRATVSSSTADPDPSDNSVNESTTVIAPKPKETKQNVLENLREHEGESKRIEKAIKELSKSLEGKLWEDDSLLDPKHGSKVFDHEKHAVKELLKVVKDESKGKDKVSDDALAASQAAIDDLLSADRILAQIAIDEVGPALDPKRQDKVDKELDKSGKEMVKAGEELAKGKPDKAIDHYKKAWKHATHALKEALKAPKGG